LENSERELAVPTYTQVATILQKALGQEEGLLVLEYLAERVPADVARQSDVRQSEAATLLEIEKVRADLSKEIEQVRADLSKEIEKVRLEVEQVRADLSKEIEQVRLEIEKVRADLTVQIERSKNTQTRWAFIFWVSQMAVLLTLLFRIL
jgi:vacuolar-type H+-ATPase subunit I/STV1